MGCALEGDYHHLINPNNQLNELINKCFHSLLRVKIKTHQKLNIFIDRKTSFKLL